MVGAGWCGSFGFVLCDGRAGRKGKGRREPRSGYHALVLLLASLLLLSGSNR